MSDYDDIPCLGICTIDTETGYCTACGRPPADYSEADEAPDDNRNAEAGASPAQPSA